MVEQVKPEVHLELCSGSFRIPTETVNYNIKILNTGESTVTAVVNQIVETETRGKGVPVDDDFYGQAARQFSNEFCRLTDSVPKAAAHATPSSPIDEVVGSAIDSLNGMVETAAEIDQVLSTVRENLAGLADNNAEMIEEEDKSSPIIDGIQGAREEVLRAKEILAEVLDSNASSDGASSGATPPAVTSEPEPKTRYLFDIDVVFQTMYELCTNETVKTHTQEARAKADTLFDKDVFLDFLSEKVPGYEEEDSFLSVPIADVLTGLINGCEDTTVVNLFRNMNKKQADIFLDQFLPLEVPATEEIVSAAKSDFPEEKTATSPGEGSNGLGLERLTEVYELLAKIVSGLEQLSTDDASLAKKTGSDGENRDDILLPKVDDLLTKTREIGPALQHTVGDLEGVLSQDVGPAQDELLSGLLDISQAMVACVTQKEENSELRFSEVNSTGNNLLEDSLLGKNDHGESGVQSIETMVENVEDEIGDADNLSMTSDESDPFDEEIVEDDDDFGEASQDDIDKLLEDMS